MVVCDVTTWLVCSTPRRVLPRCWRGVCVRMSRHTQLFDCHISSIQQIPVEDIDSVLFNMAMGIAPPREDAEVVREPAPAPPAPAPPAPQQQCRGHSGPPPASGFWDCGKPVTAKEIRKYKVRTHAVVVVVVVVLLLLLGVGWWGVVALLRWCCGVLFRFSRDTVRHHV